MPEDALNTGVFSHVSSNTKRLFWHSDVPGRINTRLLFIGLVLALLLGTILAVGRGAFPIAAADVLTILAKLIGLDFGAKIDDTQYAVLTEIRLPRVLLGLLLGASLGVSGAAMQGLFRNPLADPGLIGVSSGAALAVVSVIVLGATVLKGISSFLGVLTLPVFGFMGGLATTLIIYALAQHEGRTSLITMILAGVAVSAIAFAGIGLLTLIATDEQLRSFTFWTFGTLGGAQWKMLTVISVPMLLCLFILIRTAPSLNALMFGDMEAAHLGWNTQALKRTIIICVAALTGFAVAVAGIIGFVALVAPHLIRLCVGPDNRIVLPASALLGALLLTVADTLARTVIAPAELPIGMLTALIGAPFFLVLLLQQRRTLAGY